MNSRSARVKRKTVIAKKYIQGKDFHVDIGKNRLSLHVLRRKKEWFEAYVVDRRKAEPFGLSYKTDRWVELIITYSQPRENPKKQWKKIAIYRQKQSFINDFSIDDVRAWLENINLGEYEDWVLQQLQTMI